MELFGRALLMSTLVLGPLVSVAFSHKGHVILGYALCTLLNSLLKAAAQHKELYIDGRLFCPKSTQQASIRCSSNVSTFATTTTSTDHTHGTAPSDPSRHYSAPDLG